MNRVYNYLVIFISVMLLSSCVSEIVDNGDRIVELTFHAYARPDTKTVLAEGNEVHWLPGDEIAVTGSTEPFVASVSAPSSFAEFTGTAVEMSEYHAVYPYSLLQSWKGSVAHVLIPEVQTAVKGSFADELNVSVAMTSRKDMSLRFHNVLGYVRFTLPQEYDSIVSVSVTAEGGEALAGPAAIDCSEEQPVALPSDETSSVVTLMSPTALEAGAYYIAVIPGTYSSGLTLTFETSDHSEAVLEISRELQMNAGQIRNIGTISDLDFRKQEVNPVPDNEIWYTSSDGRLVTPYNKFYKEIFGAGLLSNIYVDGKGILQFDGAVTRVGVEAFRNKDYLTSIMLPDSVTEIGTYAFRSCDGLLEISLPSALTSIGEEAFCYCTSLEEISIPESVETIGSNAFYACAGVLNVDCNIPEGAFDISAFHEVNIGENVRSIGKYAFRGNTGLKELVIPDNVQSVGEYAFADCGQMERVAIGSGVGIIEKFAFYKTPGVLNVDCDIDDYVFCESAFHEVNIGEDVSSIGLSAFRGNTGLKEIVIPDNVQSIALYAFAECSLLERAVIGKDVRIIGNNAFDACDNLTEVICRPVMPPQAHSLFFGDTGREMVIKVPGGTKAAYCGMPYWRDYSSMIVEDDSLGSAEDNIYVSTDFSSDGRVVTLQSATVGNGIDIVILGDGYSDRMIADGTYDQVMLQAYESFFSIEPYISYKDYFNVYMVTAVSRNEFIGDGYETALSTWLGENTHIEGDNETIISYALNAVSEDRMDETLIVVPINSRSHSGTCWPFYSEKTGTDYGSGLAIAFFATGEDDVEFEQVLHHECGHGFAKLADEYFYEYKGAIPEEEISRRSNAAERFGWWKNADFTDDPSNVKWTHFLNDERYVYDGLGVFEGAFTYLKGAWRPTEISIMRHNVGGFNAPSREAIWYRIHKLAFGSGWEYDYEEFVEYDVINRKTAEDASISAMRAGNYVERAFKPTAPPVVIEKSWRSLNVSPRNKLKK